MGTGAKSEGNMLVTTVGRMKQPTLSKTKYVGGLQCHKLLWYQVNARDQIPPPSEEKAAAFDRGHHVGALAQSLYPDGKEVDWTNFTRGLALTKAYMNQRIPVFEAGFRAAGTHARADILNPVDEDAWDIIEVKSVRQVKDVFIRDIAFQRFCYRAAGVNIGRCFVMHIDPEVTDIDGTPAESLFSYADVTSEVDAKSVGLAERIVALREVAGRKDCPDIAMGDHCLEPYACMMIPLCSGACSSVNGRA